MHESTERTHLLTFLGLLLGSLVVIFWMIGPYLMALFLGGTLAMLIHPMYVWLRLKRWPPTLAALGVTLSILLLVIVPVTGFAIMAVRQGMVVLQAVPDWNGLTPQAIVESLSQWELVRQIIGDPVQVSGHIKDGLYSLGQYLTQVVLALAKGIPAFMLQTALAVVACFFFLMDGKRFIQWVLGLSTLNPLVQEKLVETFRSTAISTILASLLSCSVQALGAALGFAILGVPGAFLAGGATFLFSWLPVVGSAPVWLAGGAYLYVQGASVKMVLLLLLGAGFSMTDNVVRALMLRGQAAMHPLVGLVAVFGGINMFGILGVFIGPILAAMLISLLKLWPELRARFGLEQKRTLKTSGRR